MHTDKNVPSPAVMEEYRRQLLEMRRRAAPTTDDDWLNRHYPEPNIEHDKAAIIAPPEQPAPPIAETPFVGYLRVFTFTANEAEPIVGAQITVRRDGTLYANVSTDRDGYTPVIPLPTVDPARSLQPGGPQPYVTYDIQVNAQGFLTTQHTNVPLYGNTYVTQPIAMLPLLPNGNPDATQAFTSGGPANL